ncbi:MAG: 50S ribosomal protein L5 [Elusimicrobiota bacterium]
MSSKTNYQPRLKEAFKSTGVGILKERLKKNNVNSVPQLEKIVINIGVSAARENIKALDIAHDELMSVSGQKPTIRKSKASISAFKLREGMPIGVAVTLRGARMYEFLDRFIAVATPRIRDFRGFKPNGFDGGGNYNLGLKEQYIFPEVNVEKSDGPRGMNITFVTSTRDDKESFELLTVLGMPFAKKN